MEILKIFLTFDGVKLAGGNLILLLFPRIDFPENRTDGNDDCVTSETPFCGTQIAFYRKNDVIYMHLYIVG